jgi:hypothetical protein
MVAVVPTRITYSALSSVNQTHLHSLSSQSGCAFSGEFMVVLVAICIQLSISILGLQEQVRRLSEEVAQLQHNSEVRGKSAN